MKCPVTIIDVTGHFSLTFLTVHWDYYILVDKECISFRYKMNLLHLRIRY